MTPEDLEERKAIDEQNEREAKLVEEYEECTLSNPIRAAEIYEELRYGGDLGSWIGTLLRFKRGKE